MYYVHGGQTFYELLGINKLNLIKVHLSLY